VAVGRVLHNDLQDAALRLRPSLARVLDAGRDRGAVAGLVSGSGPTCVFLARSRADAAQLAGGLASAGVCRSVRQVTSPVPGARLLTGH
jgi:4-diphosphocytidyl-2-C-methyl-D-erythritol kinase